jgi:hypothetical protein
VASGTGRARKRPGTARATSVRPIRPAPGSVPPTYPQPPPSARRARWLRPAHPVWCIHPWQQPEHSARCPRSGSGRSSVSRRSCSRVLLQLGPIVLGLGSARAPRGRSDRSPSFAGSSAEASASGPPQDGGAQKKEVVSGTGRARKRPGTARATSARPIGPPTHPRPPPNSPQPRFLPFNPARVDTSGCNKEIVSGASRGQSALASWHAKAQRPSGQSARWRSLKSRASGPPLPRPRPRRRRPCQGGNFG